MGSIPLFTVLSIVLISSSANAADDRIYSNDEIERMTDVSQAYLASSINIIRNVCRGTASDFWRLDYSSDKSDPCMERGIELLKKHEGKSNLITDLCEDENLVKMARRAGSYGGRYDKDGSYERGQIAKCKIEARRTLPWKLSGREKEFFENPFPPIPRFDPENPENSMNIRESTIDALFQGCALDSFFVKHPKGCLTRFLDGYYGSDSSSKIASDIFLACGTENGKIKVRPPQTDRTRGLSDGDWSYRERCFERMTLLIDGPFMRSVYHACKDFKPEKRRTLPRVITTPIEIIGTPVASVKETAKNIVFDEVPTRVGEVLGNTFAIGFIPIQAVLSTVLTGEPTVSAPPGFSSLKNPVKVVEVSEVGVVTDRQGKRPYDCYLENYLEFHIAAVARDQAIAQALAQNKPEGEVSSSQTGDQKELPVTGGSVSARASNASSEAASSK